MHHSRFLRKLFLVLFFCLCFGAGRLAARSGTDAFPAFSPIQAQADNWGLSFQEEGARPVGNATVSELQTYHAYYAQDTDDKVIYLTFDCGYENGNTPAILDALKKHQVSATFFAVGTFLESEPDLVRRIVSEGHTIGNHTWHHPDMSAISSKEAFQEELSSTADAYRQITGEEMPLYYRPPQGKYSTDNLQMAKDLGYSTFFWSLAYVDWYQDNQPSKEEAFAKLLGRIHPGAIVLLHNTSSTNAAILDELLTRWEEMGYHFAALEELIHESVSPTTQTDLPLPDKTAQSLLL